jgi:septum formation protein
VTKLVLASTSPARKKLLAEAGIKFSVISPGVDEDALVEKLKPQTAHELTGLLAKAKALAVSTQFENSLVLGCDSALEFGGEILGKPLVPAVAIARWKKMRGKSGFLHSGHYLFDTAAGNGLAAVSKTEVHFADLSDAEIETYVATGEPLNVAGAFTIDGLGGAFVEKIVGDYHTVVGLSLVQLRRLVIGLGHDYQALWR